MHLCSYCSTICWNSFLFLIKFSSKFCWKSIGFSFMNLFMDSILYHWSICVFVFCYYTLLITVGLWDFIFLGSQITADGDCSHEIKRRLLLGRKLMTNLDSILKSRDITLPTKFSLVKAMVFPVVMYGCESWTVKKAEHQRIDAFELWCWRRLLRVPWTARRCNQSILKEISPGISLEGMMLKLKANTLDTSCKKLTIWKDSDARRDWGQEEKETTKDEMAGWHHRFNGCEFEWIPGDGDGQGSLACCDSWGHKESDTTDQLNRTELNWWEVSLNCISGGCFN